jgi:uncharacterized protein
MGFDQYHEPAAELPPATRTFARMCASLTEEAEAIGWYEQRLALEPDADARAVMRDAQREEFKHFSMDLEFLLRRVPAWRKIAQGVLFKGRDIVEHGTEAEAEVCEGEESGAEGLARDGSLGIGNLRHHPINGRRWAPALEDEQYPRAVETAEQAMSRSCARPCPAVPATDSLARRAVLAKRLLLEPNASGSRGRA